MRLGQLCSEISYELLQGDLDAEVRDIAYDSRKVGEGMLFVCIPGAQTDGHCYVSDAAARGACAIVVEREIGDSIPPEVAVLRTESSRRALALLSAAFFGHPAKKLVTIGVTGTKGKTTTTHMIKYILESAGKKAGLIGTLGTVIGGERTPPRNTTPESYEIHRALAEMAEAGCGYAVMEVSSQGLKLDRTAGILFDYGIFTNISPDHISPAEHASFDEYLSCKGLLFRQCRTGIANLDDPRVLDVIKGRVCEMHFFSIGEGSAPERGGSAANAGHEDAGCADESGASGSATIGVSATIGGTRDLAAYDIVFLRDGGSLGMRFCTKGCVRAEARVGIPGRFSVYNALAAMLCCHLAGISDGAILEGLSRARVRGRVEMVPVSDSYHLVIDYAHNEASTRSVLETLRAYCPGRIVCVYGGGGDRARARRLDMGRVTGELADLSVLTCDNPRSEEIRDINGDIKAGLAQSGGKYVEIDDRKEAIAYCITHAAEGDMIVLLGKGHEDYQEIKGVKYHFDEREAVAEILEEIRAGKRALEPGAAKPKFGGLPQAGDQPRVDGQDGSGDGGLP